MLINPNEPATALRANKDLFTGMQTVLCGMMDSVPDAFKPGVAALKDKVDKALVALAGQPTDQVPAAQMAGYSIQQLCEALRWMKELYDTSLANLDALMKDLSPKVAALHAFEQRIAAGDLVEKTAAETAAKAAIKTAVDEALTGERARVALLAERRTQLATAQLPAMPEPLLAAEEAAFTAAVDQAKTRLEKLTAAGVTAQLQGDTVVADLVYGPENNFSVVLKMVGSLAAKSPPPEPLAGGTAAAAASPKLRGF